MVSCAEEGVIFRESVGGDDGGQGLLFEDLVQDSPAHASRVNKDF